LQRASGGAIYLICALSAYGAANATTNHGFLYMAQDVGSVLGGPLAALLHESTGSWIPVFQLVIAMDLLTAVLCRAQADAAPLYRRPRISHGAAPAIRIGLRCARRCLGRKRKLYRADETIAAFARQGS
jgi:hypothetical protein